MIRVGVIGAGAMGQHHIRIYNEMENVELVGISDVSEIRANELSEQYGLPYWAGLLSIIPMMPETPPSEPYRDLLINAGCIVTVHDPHVLEYPGVDISHELNDVVKGANVVAILTGHAEYFGLDAGVLKGLMGQERPVVVDGRNVVDADGFIGAGFVYKGIGRGDKNDHSINNQT